MSLRRFISIVVLYFVLSTAFLSHVHVHARSEQPGFREPDIGKDASENYLQVIKSSETPYLERGGDAVFRIYVFNQSDDYGMLNVVIEDALTPDCDMTLVSLSAKQDISYTCTHEDVQSSFKNEVVVTGENATTGNENRDSATAVVEVLELSAEISSDPTSILAPGGPATFKVAVTNTGSVGTRLTSLTSPQLGDLADPTNSDLQKNTCANHILPLLAPNGGTFKCSFDADVFEQPGAYPYEIDVAGQVADGPSVSTSGATIVTIYQLISASLVPSKERVIAGSKLDLTIDIKNVSVDETITITRMEDAILGDVGASGDCLLPQVLTSGGKYGCQYQQTVDGASGETLTYSLDVLAKIGDKPAISISDTVTTSVQIFHPFVHLPYVLTVPNPTTCKTALLIETNLTYEFYPIFRNTFYGFNLEEAENVIVKVIDFITEDGQLQVFKDKGEGCSALERIGFNGDSSTEKIVAVGLQQPGTYYVYLFNGDPLSSKSPYTLLVETK